jgi:hypothetical protein
MRRILLTSVLLAIAMAIGACSKCDFPVWRGFGACHSDPPAGK